MALDLGIVRQGTRVPSKLLLVAWLIAVAVVAGCSGDEDAVAPVTAERAEGAAEGVADVDGTGALAEPETVAELEQAADSLAPGPTPIGPNTRVVLEGPPFTGLSSVANGCVLERQSEDPDLQNLYVAVVSEQRIPLDDIVVLRGPAVDCAPDEMGAHFGEVVAGRAGVLQADGTATCLSAALSDDPDQTMLRALSAIDLDQAVPADAQAETTETLDSCFVGTGIAPMVTAELRNAPILAAAADEACIEEALADPGSATSVWSAFVAAAGLEPTAVPAQARVDRYGAIERCFSVGSVLGSITAGYGFPLSGETAACLDERAGDRTLVQRVIAGDEPDPAEFMSELTDCATAEELDAINNS